MKRMILSMMTLLLSVSLLACGAQNDLLNDSRNGSENGSHSGSQHALEGDRGGANNEASNEANGDADEVDELRTVYPLTVTDASGLEMTFDKAPERIVSLSPSETEVLFALGLDERIVGVTPWCNYPEAALSKPGVGSLDGNAETIIATEPDLLVGILSLNTPQFIENYRSLGLQVFTVEPESVQEAMDRIIQLGIITDTQAQAQKVVAQMEAELQSVVEAVEQLSEDDYKKVYIEYSEGWTVGKDTFMDELVTLAGGKNIVDHVSGWIEITEEVIIQANPDVILYPSYVAGLPDIIKQRSGWTQIPAIQNDRIVAIDDDYISRPGPRLTQGLLDVARALHPGMLQ